MRAGGRSYEAAAARAVLHHHRLLQAGRELLADHAWDDVAHRAGRRNRDKAYRPRRIGLRARSSCKEEECGRHANRFFRNHPPSSRTAAVFSRSVTNSSAAVGWIPTVASSCALVRPAFTAMAMPWMISGASAP